ncbi:MAG: 50S ribosomal protein L4 [Eubacteriales bacterium]|nr:50S ribosomal protein L4 [Eubacteriales bacterium]MCI6972246.1 50S ribosomal protein L4 [Eubacterium sp.]MDD7572754.1 50S ribosomal protein L4 [Eubacteriales bacterium]MDY5355552.1 50S ribosomal protein L4 [Eubacteriales bacterium]
MAEMKVLDMSGAQVGTIDLCDAIFAVEVNEAILHAAVRMYLLNQRQGTQSALTRTEVSGGGKKPWRQKGTGRARQGSTRAPQWTHGGVAFAPKPRSYRTTMNRKTRQLAMKSALSSKVAGGEFVCVDAITASEYKTKTMVNMLKAIGAEGKALVVLSEKNDMVVRSLANIPGVKTAYANTINVYDILNCDKLVMAKGAVEQITEVYA